VLQEGKQFGLTPRGGIAARLPTDLVDVRYSLLLVEAHLGGATIARGFLPVEQNSPGTFWENRVRWADIFPDVVLERIEEVFGFVVPDAAWLLQQMPVAEARSRLEELFELEYVQLRPEIQERIAKLLAEVENLTKESS
jgi:hypothetical protein